MRVAAIACLLFLLLLLVPSATGQPAFAMLVNETQTVRMLGVTAAWAIDPAVVDASAQQDGVVLSARAPGATKVIVISVTGQHTYDVTVTARGSSGAPAAKARTSAGTAEVRYSSAVREVQNSVTLRREDPKQRTEVEVRTIHQAGDDRQAGRAQTSVATASVRLFRRNRELTLLDRDVDHSPLTLASTPLRGVHYLDEHWRLHAGMTAYATYRSFLVPIERQFVAGGGYAFRASARSTITPSLFAIRGEGAVASLIYDYRDADRLFVRGEAGFSDGLGAAAELAYDGDDDRVLANVRYRPDGFAVAGSATPRGFFGDASWTHDYGRGSTWSASSSATDTSGLRVISAGTDVDHRLTSRVALLGGASWAQFGDARTISVPAGVRFDFARGGFGALYRHVRSETNEGGHGLRLSGRVSRGRFYASAYGDRQRNAPTLDVIFSERPDLALALAELGIVATTPADIARALREHAALAELGFIEGVTLELAPSRTQLGLELAWLGNARSRQQLRARLLRNITESVAARTTTTIASLSWSRALTSATDVFASWTYWRTELAGGDARVQPFLEAGLRQRFDGSFLGGTGTISGIVFADEDLDGRSDSAGVVAGVIAEVELDGARTQKTRTDGTFTFAGVPRGPHRVVVRVPQRPEAYFTTPSRVEAETGDRVAFGVAFTPARLLARIVDDAGDPVAGVRLLLERGADRLSATAESDGELAIAASPGEWELSLVPDSIPPGYTVTGTEIRPVMLDRAQPLRVEQVLPALRTISGRAAPQAQIELRPLDRRVRADEEGHYTIRSLPPGEMTLVCGGSEQRVDVPRGPAALTVHCAAPPALSPAAAPAPGYVVQIGAFRVPANAAAAAARARAAGIEVLVEPDGALTFVRTGSLDSRAAATLIAGKLTRAGVEAVVIPR
ncbi:MAG TPA: carboxypeptidase-like regulatory domain-containing protein [Thermoanaerobaculia bacterium]|nr:carboxypeptidase-like regulatory domain-containing protein [Thermoanaerobaculia bacterium]